MFAKKDVFAENAWWVTWRLNIFSSSSLLQNEK